MILRNKFDVARGTLGKIYAHATSDQIDLKVRTILIIRLSDSNSSV